MKFEEADDGNCACCDREGVPVHITTEEVGPDRGEVRSICNICWHLGYSHSSRNCVLQYNEVIAMLANFARYFGLDKTSEAIARAERTRIIALLGSRKCSSHVELEKILLVIRIIEGKPDGQASEAPSRKEEPDNRPDDSDR